jgi:hypothetical protein
MKRVSLLGFAAFILTIAPSLSASAMPIAKQIVAADTNALVIQASHAGGHSQNGWHPTHGHGGKKGQHRGHHQDR